MSAELNPVSQPDSPVRFEVSQRIEPIRLDLFLVGQFPDVTRSLIKKAIDEGKVFVNDRVAKASYKVRYGDRIAMELPRPPETAPIPEDIPLEVLYEDDWLAVINKPWDMVVHPAKGNWRGTLVNALQFRFGKLSEINGPYRPGIVHRLDRDTSGVILVAKEEKAHRHLGLQFEQRRVYKEYHAITAGVLQRDSDYIERRITKHKYDKVKMAVTDDEEDGKDACSFYEVIERFRGFTYCRISPRTGRTHQIRVHLACIGCPVLADKVYSGASSLRLRDLTDDPGVPDEVLMPRQALHAYRLRFTHPVTGKWMEIVAPIPPEFERTLAALRRYRNIDG